ncbi:PREDICTED: DDT domain-containing protein PTM-like [Camelina sativa]|uniref:DDT domain-containing protein PTM-like n=1 Tax=Camelina sativa TaxID=90675 RepID=A0ABM0T287_CAMSA|nr:PREDICTED: DDT domain-containing protein PTM-like [Camelina sativa]
MELVGKVVNKEIQGIGFCSGTVRSRDSSGFFEIVYENGVTEISELAEVVSLVMGEDKSQEISFPVKKRVGRKPKKRSRVARMKEIKRGSSGLNEVNVDLNDGVTKVDSGVSDVNLRGNVDLNCGPVETLGRTWDSVKDLNRTVPESKTGFDLSTGLDLNPNDGLGLINVNIDYEENCSDQRRRYIDLNVDASCDLDNAGVFDLNAPKREGGFDLNVEVDVENIKDGECVQVNGNGIVQEIIMKDENGVQETGEYKEVHVAEVSSAQLLEEIQKQNIVQLQDLNTPYSNGAEKDHDLPEHDSKTVDESLSDIGNSDEYTSGRRKRRKGADNPKFTSEPRLRRSARRRLARSPVSSTVKACLVDEVSPSPSVSSLTEEKTWTLDGKTENISELPPKPQLPPSSHLLNLDGLPILDVFTAYSCLRSFSTLLFLSPFELKDFVEALRCTSPSLLFDSIHVAVLQILRKHLKQLAAEGDSSAASCLRSLDWETLDLVTYPLFVVEYLLFSGTKDNPVLDLTQSNFFRNEYFRQPANLKIEILGRLCEDMTDAEVVKSELNKRSFAVEFEMELDRKTNTEMRRRKRAMMELADDLSLNNGVMDTSFDRNSDDCCFCKMDGSLLCCDGCPAAYHSKCVGLASHLLPEGDWYCPECAFDRRVPGLKPEKQIRGAEFIEIDPHGRKYYSSCGYLLVVDTDGTGSLNYYHVNDVNLVLEQLKSCSSFYSGVISAIKKHWDIPAGPIRTISSVNSQMSPCLDKSAKGVISSMDGFKAPLPASGKQTTSGVKKKLEKTPINGFSHNHGHRTRRKISDSATGLDHRNMSSEGSAETVQNGSDVQRLPEPASSSILDIIKEPNMNIHLSSDNLARINTRKGIRPVVQCETGYRNHYIFAQMTTSVYEEMTRKSPIRTNDMRSDEEIASTQVKTILMKTTKFQWRNIQSLYLDAWKEKCGWCHSCKSSSEVAGSETNCLFNLSLGALRGLSESEVANIEYIEKNSHLLAIIYQILSMESRLQGLLGGPWLNPQHSIIWREHILKASNISSLKHLLVELEANLHHRVLSLEWLHHVDAGVVMGSAIHILIASTRSWSKTAVGKRRGSLLESGVNPTAKKNGGLTMCWWRGGQISRRLFNWKVLPRSLISKAARQGGSMTIPGVFYPENSESAKRSRRVAWEAAVESSTTSEQLGLQVRILQSYIKWDDIENSHLLPTLDKDSRKSARLFKKAIVRRKCTEEENVKYLLDFGKRRNIPDVVSKNGCMVEESSSGRKKFWLNESHVPLHLVKGFEEKKAVRKTSKPGGSFRHSKIDKVQKRSSEGKGFSYLFERAERSESSLCEQCKKDVSLSEAASCHICKRVFHKKHIRRAEKVGMYICLPCKSEVLAKEQPIVRKRGRPPGSFRKKIGVQTQKRKKVIIPARKSPRLKKTKTSTAERIAIRLKNHKKVVASKPLRRSGRQSKHVIRLQDESKVPGVSKKRKLETKRGRGRPKKVKQEISIRKERTKRCLSYWLNGLLLSRKAGDERVNKFRRDRYHIPSENSDSNHYQPKCHLCGSIESESESGLTFIACETCGEWYHGDAYGLNEMNSSMVIGFRCHLCRKQSSPICPQMRSTTSPVES